MTRIQDYLTQANGWWKKSYGIDFKFRQIIDELWQYFPLRHIIALVGLRRVGKTTIMLKMVETKIIEGFNPLNILYISFDEFGTKDLNSVLKEYEELHQKNIQNGKYLLLLDEIQKLSNWENQLKRFYDLHPMIKIIISGSESLFLQKSSKETLAGRIFTFKINPLNFREYLAFREKKFQNIKLYKRELQILWNEYTQSQGFPELVEIKKRNIIHKYLQESIMEKILFKDIPQSYSIRNLSLLESILRLISNNPGQIIELNNLCNDLHTTRQTLAQYLKYLENSFLIQKVYNFSRDLRKTERKKKRYYPTILSTNLTFKNDNLSKSIVFECRIMALLHSEFFWRDSAQHEVDAIIKDEDGSIRPIEIKYGKIKTKNLFLFMKRFDFLKGYVISKEKDYIINQGKKNIHVIPAIEYFLKTAKKKKNL